MLHRRFIIAAGLAATLGTATVFAAHGLRQFVPGTTPGTYVGPTSSETPYVTPTAEGWEVISLLTVGDTAGEAYYQMAGIPDGLGALAGRLTDQGRVVADKAYMTVVMNHELGGSAGAVRAHGQTGAFVSQWSVHLNSLQVKWGQDLIQDVYTWNGVTDSYDSAAGLPASRLSRLCSADLPPVTAFYNPRTRRGFDGRIFTSGEESGNEGRAFAHILTGPEKGRSYELAYTGQFSWENIVAHPDAGDRTLVMGLDDQTPGQLYLYVGQKQRHGNPVERAGLHGGRLYGITVTNGGVNYGEAAVPLENGGAINGYFSLTDVSEFALKTGAELQAFSVAEGVTEFARPEDGHWDTRDPRAFYFVTTGALGQDSRLYKLTLDSLHQPTGGRIELVVEAAALVGTDGQNARTFDNMTVDDAGQVLVQEDPGGSSYIAKTWRIEPTTGDAVQILESDRERFTPGLPGFLTSNEESSGIIEVTDIVKHASWYQLGRRYYLADMQAHYGLPSPLVEGGQLYLVASPRTFRHVPWFFWSFRHFLFSVWN